MKKIAILALLTAALLCLTVCTAWAGTLETQLFSVEFSDEWTYKPDRVADREAHAYAALFIDDPNSSSHIAEVDVTCDVNSAADFAQEMSYAQLDVRAALAENPYPVRTIGGVDFWTGEKGRSVNYYGYIPEKNAFIQVAVYGGEKAQAYTDALLEKLTFTFKDYEGQVLPWYWDGTPYAIAECSSLVNGHVVTAKMLPIDAVEPCYTVSECKMDVAGDAFYILADKKLKKYVRSGDALAFDCEIELPFEARTIAANGEGNVYLSGFGKKLTLLAGGAPITVSGDTEDVAVHPSKTWGVSYFSSKPLKKVDLLTGTVAELGLTGFKSIKKVHVTQNCLIVDGSLEDGTACARFYDFDLNLKGQLDKTNTTTKSYGGASAVAETANGFMVFDLNGRKVYFLDTDLNVVSAAGEKDILGTGSAWPSSAIAVEDGTVYLLAPDTRPDRTASEVVVFQLSGY